MRTFTARCVPTANSQLPFPTPNRLSTNRQMGGLSYLEYVRGLAKRVESDWDGVRGDLLAIRSALLSR